MASHSDSKSSSRPRGYTYRGLMLAVLLVVAVPAIAYSVWPSLRFDTEETGPIVHTVERGPFVHEITERGTIESASNVEIRCEVQAKGAAGTTILEIIPEGTYVQAGDILCKLDSSALEDDQTRQQIVCSNSEAQWIKAQNDYQTALIEKREYEEGTFLQQEQEIESEMKMAEENVRRASDYLTYSERLAVRGYVTQLQLEGDRYALEKAIKDKDLAETKLRVLRDFTKAKMLKQLESSIATAEASQAAAERTYKLDKEQLELIEEQIEKCVIKAPEPGQVVYANETSSRGSAREVIIGEGETVRERQVIIRLPDPKRMQVKAKVNEARVSLVTTGMPCSVRMDAFADVDLTGEVVKVNEYPLPTSFFNPNVKEYETTVSIHESPPGIRPGLTAEVRILVERVPDVLQVPVQAVFEHAGQFYCVTRGEKGWVPRPVTCGSTNDKTVVIKEGLQQGEQVVLNSSALRDSLGLAPVPLVGGGSSSNGAAPGAAPGDSAAQGGTKDGGPDGPGGPSGPEGSGGPGRPSSGGSKGGGGNLFGQYDPDGDGKIPIDSLPEELRGRLQERDANGDGQLERSELPAGGSGKRRPGGGEGGGGPDGGPRPDGGGRGGFGGGRGGPEGGTP
ncbi:MAG: HlyD family efflux transporter periplasmic adaptor subunit [Planctomycetota bacterium]